MAVCEAWVRVEPDNSLLMASLGIAASASASASEYVANKFLKFAVGAVADKLGERDEVFEIVKADAAPESFDALVVLSIPLKDQRKAAVISNNFTHSMVVAIDAASGRGVVCEYTFVKERPDTSDRGRGAVLMESSRLVIAEVGDGEGAGKDVFMPDLDGFVHLPRPLTMDRLRAFNDRFQAVSPYYAGLHDCHTYHKSLVVSALLAEDVYYFRGLLPKKHLHVRASDVLPKPYTLPKLKLVRNAIMDGKAWHLLKDGYNLADDKLFRMAAPPNGYSVADTVANFKSASRAVHAERKAVADKAVEPKNMALRGEHELPPGWSEHTDDDTGHSYFHNENTGQSSWERPT